MDTRDVACRRMYGHHIWGPPLLSLEAVVGSFAAMQAQEFVPAKWSVAQRSVGVTEAAVNKSFADGKILRTHVLRPTWHFVRREDIRWLVDLTRPRVHQLNANSYRRFGLDDDVFAKCNALFRRTLSRGAQLTRKELAVVLEKAGITASGLRLGYILMGAELDSVIVSGTLSGKQQTYALFDDRVPDTKTFGRDEALAELAKRYFAMRGPATIKDFAQWSSLTAADARSGLSMIKSQVERLDVDGRTYWAVPSAAVPAPKSPVINLIQGYDEYVMSYSESKDVLFRTGEQSSGGDPTYLHTILLDGQMIGHWKHTSRSRSVEVETVFYRRLTAVELRALDWAVDQFGRFMGVPARSSVGQPASSL